MKRYGRVIDSPNTPNAMTNFFFIQLLQKGDELTKVMQPTAGFIPALNDAYCWETREQDLTFVFNLDDYHNVEGKVKVFPISKFEIGETLRLKGQLPTPEVHDVEGKEITEWVKEYVTENYLYDVSLSDTCLV